MTFTAPRLLLEAVFVGGFTLTIYLAFSYLFILPEYTLLFVIGGLKHALGYFTGLQRYYCKCSQHKNVKVPTPFEIVGEGALFVVLGAVLKPIQTMPLKLFLTGFSAHIIFDVLGGHRWFCKTHCMK